MDGSIQPYSGWRIRDGGALDATRGPLAKGGQPSFFPPWETRTTLLMAISSSVRIMAAHHDWDGLLAGSRATMCAVARAKAQMGQRP